MSWSFRGADKAQDGAGVVPPPLSLPRRMVDDIAAPRCVKNHTRAYGGPLSGCRRPSAGAPRVDTRPIADWARRRFLRRRHRAAPCCANRNASLLSSCAGPGRSPRRAVPAGAVRSSGYTRYSGGSRSPADRISCSCSGCFARLRNRRLSPSRSPPEQDPPAEKVGSAMPSSRSAIFSQPCRRGLGVPYLVATWGVGWPPCRATVITSHRTP
jgi:hypothetical protein